MLKFRYSYRPYSALCNFKSLRVSNKGKVVLIELDRPVALNALNSELTVELSQALKSCDQNDECSVVVLTGSEKSFAAGADISEMAPKTFADCYNSNYLGHWSQMFREFRKPIIAAVNGFALGGGCELAMMCDILYAGAKAKFSQPEIKLGTLPGGGGTQRLTKAVGKSKAMEMILTGRHISAEEAEKIGLVSKVFPPEQLVDEAIKVAQEISRFSLPVIKMCKEAINKSFELNLCEGLEYERRLFHSSFAMVYVTLEPSNFKMDRNEGMSAFLEKRPPIFRNQ